MAIVADNGPIIDVQLGPGNVTPRVSSVTVRVNGQAVPACSFDETSYTGSSGGQTSTGRTILDQRDAVVILPANSLPVGATVEVTLVVNSQTISWTFSTIQSPPPPG